jgi:tetrahydromethanopterin S-methyltransferase subunit B
MRKLNIVLKWKNGLFSNSKNEQILAMSINELVEKINELVDEVEYLKEQLKPPTK